MSICIHHLDKWISANTDYIEETLETEKKAIVILGGASSSGKSFLSTFLEKQLIQMGHKPEIISLDQYNVGISSIIPNKVNSKFYDNSLPQMKEIRKRIKEVIFDVPFNQKYSEPVLEIIREKLKDIISLDMMDDFLKHLHEEWKVLNFDESTVYDLREAASDIHKICAGEDIEAKNYSKFYSERVKGNHIIHSDECDVIIVEGIYALNSLFLEGLKEHKTIKNFIDSDPKTLFLRRIIRDSTKTSAGTLFTISAYFRYIVDEYNRSILPNRDKADIIYFNKMSFSEMRSGVLFTSKTEIRTTDKAFINSLIQNNTILEQRYMKDIFFNVHDETNPNDNILRLRLVSEDKGLTYEPSSLVHKGFPKFRMDGKKIRPINIFIQEGQFHQVWKDTESCIDDFLHAGLIIGNAKKKIKTKLDFHGEVITIREIENDCYYIEYSKEETGRMLRALGDKLSS